MSSREKIFKLLEEHYKEELEIPEFIPGKTPVPVSGKFNDLQKDIYNLVWSMQDAAFNHCKPGNSYKEAHLEASKIATRLGIGINAGHDLNMQNLGEHTQKNL